MKIIPYLLFAALVWQALLARAATFKETAGYLDTDGITLSYFDFSGDGQRLAENLEAIYVELGEVKPQFAILPINFEELLAQLGFAAIESIGFSSKEISPEVYCNRGVAMLKSAPTGLLKFYALPEASPRPFVAATLAPADASGAFGGVLNWNALGETTSDLFSQVLGPLGEMVVQSQLRNPIAESELTPQEILDKISTHWDGFYKINASLSNNLDLDFWIRIEGAGELSEKLKPLAKLLGVNLIEEDVSLNFHALKQSSSKTLSLYAKNTAKGDLILYTNPNWTAKSEGPKLTETDSFKKLATHLPTEAIWNEYGSGYDILQYIQPAVESHPGAAPYMPMIEKASEYFISDLFKPYANSLYFDNSNILIEHYGSWTPKHLLGLIPTSIAVSAAIPHILKAFSSQTETTKKD
jgi:hypothetical protein